MQFFHYNNPNSYIFFKCIFHILGLNEVGDGEEIFKNAY